MLDLEKTTIVTGDDLRAAIKTVEAYERRGFVGDLERYLNSGTPEICVLYGLRRTGKTTAMYHAISDIEDKSKCVYIHCKHDKTMTDLYKEMERLWDEGVRYYFIDEITSVPQFEYESCFLADIYARKGARIVVAGTDSLMFFLTSASELYDRTHDIHTTFIPYAEFTRLLQGADIDEYIRQGGTLYRENESPFINATTAEEYVTTSIADNIQHALSGYLGGARYGHLAELHGEGELTNLINRVVQLQNHDFVVGRMTETFRSHDYGLANKNLVRKGEHALIDGSVDRDSVLAGLKESMKILDKRKVELSQEHMNEVEFYLKELEVTDTYIIKTTDKGITPLEQHLITQPGLRYAQANELVEQLRKDPFISDLEDERAEAIVDEVRNTVKGFVLEEIILNETRKVLPEENYDVFKQRGHIDVDGKRKEYEYDMVIRDKEEKEVYLFEVKHSDKMHPSQSVWLTNEQALAITKEKRSADIVARAVIYNGPTGMSKESEGVLYLNASEFLSGFRWNDDIPPAAKTIKPPRREAEVTAEIEMPESELANYIGVNLKKTMGECKRLLKDSKHEDAVKVELREIGITAQASRGRRWGKKPR